MERKYFIGEVASSRYLLSNTSSATQLRAIFMKCKTNSITLKSTQHLKIIFFYFRVSLTLACPMNLKLFPLDTQTCHLTIASYGWTSRDLQYIWKVHSSWMWEMKLTNFSWHQSYHYQLYFVFFTTFLKQHNGLVLSTCLEVRIDQSGDDFCHFSWNINLF